MWVSLTSIGPRKACLIRAVKALLRQRGVRLAGILLTLPTTTLRSEFPPYTAVECAELKALSSLVVVHRPREDLGPAMKYCGAEQQLPPKYTGAVFVGDDDQQYHPRLLYRMHRLSNWNTVLQNRLETTKECTRGGLIRGYAGLLLRRRQLHGVTKFIRRAPLRCRVVDDDLVSLFLWRRGVRIQRGIERNCEIFAGGEPTDDTSTALHRTTPRAAATAAVFAWGQCLPTVVQCAPPHRTVYPERRTPTRRLGRLGHRQPTPAP